MSAADTPGFDTIFDDTARKVGINSNDRAEDEATKMRCEEDNWSSWPASSKFPEAIAVENGIRIKSASQGDLSDPALKWWARRWLEFISASEIGYRWQRALKYAVQGQVLSIDVNAGLVRASVQGAQLEPYRVTIHVKSITPDKCKSVLAELTATSQFGIELLSGSLLPEEDCERIFSKHDLSLLPRSLGDLQTKCTCLDWSNPCKHIAAVAFVLAEEFARQPRLLLALRGINDQSIFAKLGSPKLEAATQSLSNFSTNEASSELSQLPDLNLDGASQPVSLDRAGAVCKTENENKSEDAKINDNASFWQAQVKEENILVEWSNAQSVATLPASLGSFPFWQSKYDFLSAIRVAYEFTPAEAMRLLSRSADKTSHTLPSKG